MGYHNKILSRGVLAVVLLTGFFFLGDGHAKAKNADFENINPPDEEGPYNVGTRTFGNVAMSEIINGVPRKTSIQVYYPTLDPPNCETKYTIQEGAGFYLRSSPLCAVQDATMASGLFPLVAYAHGGAAGGNRIGRFEQLPLNELLASHGFVVVAAPLSANNPARVRDISLVINFMLGLSTTSSDPPNPLSIDIDPDRIGIWGYSNGGRTALGVAGGWADPPEPQGAPFPPEPMIPADTRVKAMVLYEPGRDTSLDDVKTIAIPYLVMRGTRFVSGIVQVPELFDVTVLATPRIHVLNPEALHLSYYTDLCPLITETREAALQAGESEPLTNMIPPFPQPSPPSPPRPCNSAMGVAGLRACTSWNQGEINFPRSGSAFGGGRNLCNKVGVKPGSPPLPPLPSPFTLDTDPNDGFTDVTFTDANGNEIPLFEANDNWNSNESTVGSPAPMEIMEPMVTLYTVSFFKKFLEGDGRYMRYLTPGYAKTQGFDAAEVEIRE